VGEIQDLQLKLDIQKNLLLQKGLQSNDPEKIIEAARHFKDIDKRPESNIKSYLFDPWEFTHQFGFKDKPTSLSYDTLRKMGRTPIINSIITKRVEQVAAFTEPCFDEKSTGFIIRKKAGYFSDNTSKTLSREDKAKISFITDFIINCGTDANSWHGDSFDSFLRKATRDSMELDQLTFEVVRNRKGIPEEFIAVDAATMRLADSYDDDEYKNRNRIAINGYFPSYVQIFQMQPINDFYPWELCFGVRNHYTDVRLNGYGISELENLINIVTWMLYSDQYNGKFFSQGSAPKGILTVKGSISESKMQEFRQAWQSMIAGVQNSWKTPVIESDSMQYIDLHKNNREMEFSKWQEYLIKLACATYKIDPSEIGFPMNGSSSSQPMFEGNNEARLKYSKDSGLTPILKTWEHKLNKYVVKPLDPNFELKFVGMNPESEKNVTDLDIKKAASFMSLKEVRRKHNLPDLPEDKDDLILNPYYMQNMQAQQQMAMQGNQESNAAMDNENPFQGFDENNDQQTNKGEVDPFTKAFNNFLEKELK
jgi:hypothetical protein